MQSERTIGRALVSLMRKYKFDRSELIISSKAGYLPEDGQEMIS